MITAAAVATESEKESQQRQSCQRARPPDTRYQPFQTVDWDGQALRLSVSLAAASVSLFPCIFGFFYAFQQEATELVHALLHGLW